MFDQLKKKPFKERLKDTGYLIKHSFLIAGKDEDIKTPTIRMMVLSFILTTVFFTSVLLIVTGEYVFSGILLLIFLTFVLLPLRIIYDMFQRANQSWIVYNTVIGGDISYKDSQNHSKTRKGKIFLLALTEIAIKYAGMVRSGKGGVTGMLVNLFLSALNEVWDLIGNYLVPAVMVEDISVKQIVPRLKGLKNNIPATLVGVFGIDFVGGVVSTILFPIYFVFLLLAFLTGWLVAFIIDGTIITIGSIEFSWVPIFIIMYGIFVMGGLLRKVIESVKVIYFTIFYTTLTRPMKIDSSMRDDLTHYLKMEAADFKNAPKPTPRQQYVSKLADYIEQYQASGNKKGAVVDYLKGSGYSLKDITHAMKEVDRRKSFK